MIKKGDRVYSLDDVKAMLSLVCEAYGGQQAWAQQHKISRRFIWGTINGKHPPTTPILKALGLQKITTYRKV